MNMIHFNNLSLCNATLALCLLKKRVHDKVNLFSVLFSTIQFQQRFFNTYDYLVSTEHLQEESQYKLVAVKEYLLEVFRTVIQLFLIFYIYLQNFLKQKQTQ